MAGYSGTPLPRKLGIKADHRVALINAPQGFDQTLGALPAGVETCTGLAGRDRFDVIVFFTKDRTALRRQFGRLARRLTPAGGLWISWPKKASGLETDLNENAVRKIGLDQGLVDNKICAVDGIWSGLRFVIRLRDRPSRASSKHDSAV